MLKTLSMVLVRFPVGIFEEIIAVFQIKKSQIDTENDKIPKFFFQGFYEFLTYRKIFERLRELEKYKGPTRKKLVVQTSFLKSLLHFSKLKCLELTRK